MATLHDEISLSLNADSVEWCPVDGHSDLLAAGTYQLDEATEERLGRLYMFRAIEKAQQSCKLHEEFQTDTSGIFDMRWAPHHTRQPTLALALADGSVSLVRPDMQIGRWHQTAFADLQEGMVLTVDWVRHPAHEGCAVASTSNGQLAVLQEAEAGLVIEQAWHGHDLEAWCIAGDCWQAGLVFSGADDCTLKGWDVRQQLDRPVFSDKRSHSAGVCCMQSSPTVEHMLVTGSYDEHVRVWDLRMLHKPVCVSQVTTGGGVWRLKWHPHDSRLLLAACMHNGFAIVKLSEQSLDSSLAREEEYAHQKTLGYGAGWCHMALPGGGSLVATCSFYDRLLHLWQPATQPCLT